MDNHHPRSREKKISGPAVGIKKRGSGLGTGPVGGAQAGAGRPEGPLPSRAGGTARAGGFPGGLKGILLLLMLLFGGAGGLFLGGQQDGQAPAVSSPAPAASGPVSAAPGPGAGQVDWGSLLNGLSGGSVSGGWTGQDNTGRLDTSVDPAAREKRVQLLGGGRDTATIMVYLCGTDLESRSGMGTSDLQEMLAARFGDQINLLIYTGGCTGWRNSQVSSNVNQVWQVKDGNLLCLQPGIPAVSMTDPDTLAGYIRWCAESFPASRYGLILWDHGGGSLSGYGYDEKFASSGAMGLPGIRAALEKGGVAFDFIGFDACLMATVENALMLADHADYLIASEETEPGVGWYYTDWLTQFGENTSMPTIALGQQIADSFVATCQQKCPGQPTTLSVVDLAELEATIPELLAEFSQAASSLIVGEQYQQVSGARSKTREFARSSRIDQVDLVHLAQNLGGEACDALAQALLGCIKYNRTSPEMTNAYGLSAYFPYRNVANVDKAVATYRQLGMEEGYSRCIQQFASLEASGQAVSGGTASPLPALLGSLQGGGGELLAQVLGGFLGGDFGRIAGLDRSNTGFLSGAALDDAQTAAYLEAHRFQPQNLVWSEGENGIPLLRLDAQQWDLVQQLDYHLFYDDGEGYIDLGLDNVFEIDDTGALLGVNDGSWLAIDGQPVAYYHTATVEDGERYTITGRVPVMHNGQRAELLLCFDEGHPEGYVSGITAVYADGETETVAKSGFGLQPGDTLEFLCDYYSYSGEYRDSYLLGEPLQVQSAQPAISNRPLSGKTRAFYRFTDIYCQHYWTPDIP